MLSVGRSIVTILVLFMPGFNLHPCLDSESNACAACSCRAPPCFPVCFPLDIK